MKTIKEFQQFKSNFENGYVSISPGVSYYLLDLIETNNRLRNAKFSDEYYPDGTKKLFFNVARIMSYSIYKNTDMDIKDIKLHPLTDYTMKIAPLLRPVIHAYLKLEDFGEDMNYYRQEMIDMGHIIVKEVEGESVPVNLLNIIRPPHIMDLQQGGLIEKLYYTWDDMLAHKKDWEKHWDKIEELKQKMDAEQQLNFIVYEWWTTDEFKIGRKTKFTKGCIKYLNREIERPSDEKSASNWQPFIELERFATPYSQKIRSKKKIDRLQREGFIEKGKNEMPIFPYEEQRFLTIPGRWLGLGIYELTNGMMEYYNENMNEKRRYDQLAHKGILVHKQSSTGEQKTLTQEFLSNLDTGAILQVENDEDLTRLNMGSLVNDFLGSGDKIFELARQITGVTAQGTGEEIPSATTATIGMINQETAKSTYDIVNEQQDLFLRRLFEKFKIKSMLRDLTSKEFVEITGDPKDLVEMEAGYAEQYAYQKVLEGMETGESQKEVLLLMDRMGVTLREAQDIFIDKMVEIVKQEMGKGGDIRFAQITENLIKNIDFNLEFYIINEAFDAPMRARAITEALARPMVMLSREKLEEEWADLVGLSGRRLRKTEEEREAEALMAQQAMDSGGGTPSQPNTPREQAAKTQPTAQNLRQTPQ
jgi:hypothetical protein